MGQKVNPKGFRLKVINTWDSLWYADRDYASKLHEDILLRRYVERFLHYAAVSKIVIARKTNVILITIYSAKPGSIIGKKGDGIEKMKEHLSKIVSNSIEFNISEIKKPELDAVLVAKGIAQQLEKRVSFRRAMKRALSSCIKVGAKGMKVTCSGRLGGADIARTEYYKEGRIPLHTLRANIDYGLAQAKTSYGIIGVKVWVYVGDVSASS